MSPEELHLIRQGIIQWLYIQPLEVIEAHICANKFNPPKTKPKETFVEKAVRSNDADGTAYHLISPIALARLAATYREGSNKYGDHNWEKGFPIGDCINHALRHINYFNAGDRSEDHLAHAAWSLFAIMHYQSTHPELQSHIFTDKAKEILDAIQAPKVEKHAADTNADPAVPV